MGRVKTEQKLQKCLRKLEAVDAQLAATNKKLDTARINVAKISTHCPSKKKETDG